MSWLGTVCEWAAGWFICSAIVFVLWVASVELGHLIRRGDGRHRRGEPLLALLWRVKPRGKYRYHRPGELIHLRTILGTHPVWYGIATDPDTPIASYVTFGSTEPDAGTLEIVGDEAVTWLNPLAGPTGE